MKRKIFHTLHGRIMLKITSMYRNKYEAIFIIDFNSNLLSEFATGCRQKIESKSKNRNMLRKGFKRFTQAKAEEMAKDLYEDLPEPLKREGIHE